MAIAQTNKRDDIRQHNQRPQDDEEAARQLIESGANIEAEAEEFKMFVSQHINSMSQGAAQASKSVRHTDHHFQHYL